MQLYSHKPKDAEATKSRKEKSSILPILSYRLQGKCSLDCRKSLSIL